MNTYRVFICQANSDNTNGAIVIAYVQADKYGPAWQAARALLNDGKPHKDVPQSKALFDDLECKTPSKVGFGDHLTVARIVDLKKRNVKLDKTALQAILNDPKTSAEDKLKAMQAMVGATPAPAAPATT